MANCLACLEENGVEIPAVHISNGVGSCERHWRAQQNDEKKKSPVAETVKDEQKWVSINKIDWAAVQKDRNSGTLTLKEMEKKYSVSVATICKNTKPRGFETTNLARPVKVSPPAERPLVKPNGNSETVSIEFTAEELRETIVAIHTAARTLNDTELNAYKSKAVIFAKLAWRLDQQYIKEFPEQIPKETENED